MNDKGKDIKIDNIKPIYIVYPDGKIFSKHKKGFLKPTLGGHGYYYVSLMDINNKPRKRTIHSLVAHHFVEGYSEGLIVDHKDSDKLNNHYTNLEWVSYKENYMRARRNSLILLGEKLDYAKLSDGDVHMVCRMLQNNKSYSEIIENLSHIKEANLKSIVISIKARAKWKHISSNYSWSEEKRNSKFSQPLLRNICSLISEGKGATHICRVLDLDDYQQIKKLVWFIKKGKVHKELAREFKII